MNDDCIFCKIINKEIPANIVYEDDNIIGFLDVNPINSGHVLIIPKTHYVNIFDIPENILQDLIVNVKVVAGALNNISEGVNVMQNNKRAAGQIIDHFHFHVIPRYPEDGLRNWPGKKYDSEEEIKVAAEKIKKAISEIMNKN
jgi:histidine triad (HIT) family protein